MSDVELLGVSIITDVCVFNLLIRYVSDSEWEKRVVRGAVANDKRSRGTTNKESGGGVFLSERIEHRMERVVILMVGLPVQFTERYQPIGELLDGMERRKTVHKGAEAINMDQIGLIRLRVG